MSGSTWPSPYKALVVGARGAIGSAFMQHLQADPHCQLVVGVSREHPSGFDLEDTSSFERLAQHLQPHAPFDLVIDATGVLDIDGLGPEKSLAALNREHLLRSFSINAAGPILLMRQLVNLMSAGNAVYAKLSARVGSIADNRKGGWYGYRASKAALNMFLQTAAVEVQRKRPSLRVVAMQPGTVRSRLSAPYTSGLSHVLEPQAAVEAMMHVLSQLPLQTGAKFLDYKGQAIAW